MSHELFYGVLLNMAGLFVLAHTIVRPLQRHKCIINRTFLLADQISNLLPDQLAVRRQDTSLLLCMIRRWSEYRVKA